MQAIRTKHQNVARMHLMIADFHIRNQIVPQRPAQQMARLRLARLFRRQNSQPHLFSHHRVISRELGRQSVADQIASGISHVRGHHAVIPQRAGHHRRRHMGPARTRRAPQFINLDIRFLNDAGHQSRMRFASGRGPEPRNHGFHGALRGNFPKIFPAHAIRQNKKPPLRAAFILRRRGGASEIIFVVVAYAANIGEFAELEIEHGLVLKQAPRE